MLLKDGQPLPRCMMGVNTTRSQISACAFNSFLQAKLYEISAVVSTRIRHPPFSRAVQVSFQNSFPSSVLPCFPSAD